jgi:hypothetical protein
MAHADGGGTFYLSLSRSPFWTSSQRMLKSFNLLIGTSVLLFLAALHCRVSSCCCCCDSLLWNEETNVRSFVVPSSFFFFFFFFFSRSLGGGTDCSPKALARQEVLLDGRKNQSVVC